MNIRSLLESLAIVKTQQHIEKEKVMAIIGATPATVPMTQGENDPHAPFGGMPGVPIPGSVTSPPATDPTKVPNPWSDPVVKDNLKAQRAVYAGALVDFVNQKQELLDKIAQVEDQLEQTLRVINDLDVKIKS